MLILCSISWNNKWLFIRHSHARFHSWSIWCANGSYWYIIVITEFYHYQFICLKLSKRGSKGNSNYVVLIVKYSSMWPLWSYWEVKSFLSQVSRLFAWEHIYISDVHNVFSSQFFKESIIFIANGRIRIESA